MIGGRGLLRWRGCRQHADDGLRQCQRGRASSRRRAGRICVCVMGEGESMIILCEEYHHNTHLLLPPPPSSPPPAPPLD